MRACATARSISRPVREHLRGQPSAALRVLAVFERACDLVSPGDHGPRSVIALVTPEIGNGPLNIVLAEGSGDLTRIDPGARAHTDGERLQIGGLEIDLSEADVWEPRPDWPALRARRPAIQTRLPALQALSLGRARQSSFLSLLCECPPESGPSAAVLTAARSACQALEAGWVGDQAQLQEAAAQLAGLGGGLTPSGDDFLCGAMLWAWLAHPSPSTLCRAIVATAAPRTTILSGALLGAAARGECNAAWHGLLDALAQGDDVRVARATGGALKHGATSGADTLAGFLWAGTQTTTAPQRT